MGEAPIFSCDNVKVITAHALCEIPLNYIEKKKHKKKFPDQACDTTSCRWTERKF